MDPSIVRVLLLLGGVFLCFRGYSAARALLGVTAFVVAAHATWLHLDAVPAQPVWLGPAVVVAVGLVAALVVGLAYRFGLLLLGAGVFVLVASRFHESLPAEGTTRLLIYFVVGAVGAALSRVLERGVLSIGTALYGALMITSAIAGAAPERVEGLGIQSLGSRLVEQPWLLALGGGLAVAGALTQLFRRRRED